MSSINDNVFDLSLVPQALYPNITEKMEYTDFSVFESCSKLSSQMSTALPKCVKLPIEMYGFEAEKDKIQISLTNCEGYLSPSDIPFKVQIHFDVFRVIECDNREIVNFVKRHNVSTYQASFDTMTEYPCYVQELMELLKPQYFTSYRPNKEILSLPAVRSVPSLKTSSDIDSDEEVLLNLKAVNIVFGGGSFTAEGVAKFIQQWIDGTRTIEEVHLSWNRISLGEIQSLLHQDVYVDDPTEKQTIYICRNPDHKDCVICSINLGISLCQTEKTCPKRVN